ncbi:unnamed protein product [Echinostoma caproni]|uniref:Secreted protein n=1 Tax=Echinostoma caproni TaxID=27848 RepID=A0A183A7L6_9TREM|nr:unnamed protein product [Echinostoma caproni]
MPESKQLVMLSLCLLLLAAALAEPKVRVQVNDRRSGVAYFVPHDAPDPSVLVPSPSNHSEREEVRQLLMEDVINVPEDVELTKEM